MAGQLYPRSSFLEEYGDKGAALWEKAKLAEKPAERPAVAKQPATGKQTVAAKQRVAARNLVAAEQPPGAKQPPTSGAGTQGSGSAARTQTMSSQPASAYTVKQAVEGRWWVDAGGEVPCSHREWCRASVVQVNAAANTLDLFYEDNTAASAVPAAHVRQSRQRAGPASGLDPSSGTALIERIRAVAIERNRLLHLELGLGDNPLNMQRRPKAPRPAAPRLLVHPAGPPRRASRLHAGPTDELAPYRLGFDLGFATALLSHQSFALFHLLVVCYGEAAANAIIDQHCVTCAGQEGAAGSTSAATSSGAAGSSSGGGGGLGAAGADSDDTFGLVLFARVGSNVVGATLIRVHSAAQSLTEPLLEVVFIAVRWAGHGIGRALFAYAQLVADKAPAGGKLVLWRSGAEPDAASELPDTSGWETLRHELPGLALHVPAHMPPAPESKLLESPRALGVEATAFRKLRVQVACCVHSLVASDTAAHKAAAAAELAAMQGVSLEEDLEPIVTFDEQGQLKLPDADDLQGRLPAYVALFGHDRRAKFFVARIDSMTTEEWRGVGSGSSLPSAGALASAGLLGEQKTVTKVDVTVFVEEVNDEGDFKEEEHKDPLCLIPTLTLTPAL